MIAIDFAKGAAPKAGKGGGVVSAIVGAIAGDGGCGNGTAPGGKKGFQPGNKCHQGRNQGVTSAQKAHTAANKVTHKHIRAGTLNTPEGRAAVRTAAKAARVLKDARDTHKAAQKVKYAENAKARRSATKVAKATASTPQGQAASALKAAHAVANPTKAAPAPKPAPPKPSPKPGPTAKEHVAKASKEASDIKGAYTAIHLRDLHGAVKAGVIDAPSAHILIDKIAKGASKDHLSAAAKGAGIEHKAKTKKALVEHLKAHATATAKPVKPSEEAAKAQAVKDATNRVTQQAKSKGVRSYTDPTKPRPESVVARDEIHEKIGQAERKHHADYVKSLAPEQRTALTQYKQGSVLGDDGKYKSAYHEVNQSLRGGGTHALVPDLDSAIARSSVPHDVVVYRGIEDMKAHGFKSGPEAVGSTIHDKAYVSTSLSHYTAHTFAGGQYGGENSAIIRTRLPKGSKAAFADAIHGANMHENEYVLPRGSQFRVTGYGGKTPEGVHILDAELHHGHVGFAAEPESPKKPPAKPDEDRSDRFTWKPGDVTITRPSEKGGKP